MIRRPQAAAVFIAAVTLSLSMALSPAVNAVTYTNILGEAFTTQYRWFTSPRTISNSADAGPEVVHKQYTGPNGLQLGAYRCGQIGTFPWGRYPQDFSGVYRTVADGVPDDTVFCLFSLSDSGSGDFTGRLGWD